MEFIMSCVFFFTLVPVLIYGLVILSGIVITYNIIKKVREKYDY